MGQHHYPAETQAEMAPAHLALAEEKMMQLQLLEHIRKVEAQLHAMKIAVSDLDHWVSSLIAESKRMEEALIEIRNVARVSEDVGWYVMMAEKGLGEED